MESTFVRGFVLLVALTGFGASTVSSHAPKSSSKTSIHSADVIPPPMCLPNTGNFCGLQ